MPILPTRISGRTGDAAWRGSSSVHGSVPTARKPKSRPPKGIRDKLRILHKTLPYYTGPYSVGVMDVEVPAERPRSFSHIKCHHQHLLKLETVLFTLYYPSNFNSGSGEDPTGKRHQPRETWLPRPRIQTSKGYRRFTGVPEKLAVLFFAPTTMFTKLPAFRNAHPARHWPAARNEQSSGYSVKTQEGLPPEEETERPCFPLLIFSHGLGGTQKVYSSLCGEFASYGFVVCALEHHDSSGPRTFVNHASEGPGSREDIERQGDRGVDHTASQKEKNYDRIDYIYPLDNPSDTAPHNEKGMDEELRRAQLQLRLAEIEEAYRLLVLICNEKGDEVAAKNLRKKGYIGGSSEGLDRVDWSAWKNVFYLDQVTILGHSFGGATTVEVLRKPKRFNFISQGVIYDIWGAPVKTPDEKTHGKIQRPLLGINSEAFMYWQANFDTVMSLMDEAKSHGAPAWLMTVRGTIHISQSDFSILYPHLSTFLLKMTADPKCVVDLNVTATLEFLQTVMKDRAGVIKHTMRDESILRVPIVEDLPQDLKPESKWTAVRLKVPHKFRTQVVPRLERKLKRSAEPDVPLRNEIWMHVMPTDDEISSWCGTEQDYEQDDDSLERETSKREDSRERRV